MYFQGQKQCKENLRSEHVIHLEVLIFSVIDRGYHKGVSGFRMLKKRHTDHYSLTDLGKKLLYNKGNRRLLKNFKHMIKVVQ